MRVRVRRYPPTGPCMNCGRAHKHHSAHKGSRCPNPKHTGGLFNRWLKDQRFKKLKEMGN